MTTHGKGNEQPTESDVARLAGVSQSAVSRAFTPGASIAERTRERVIEAAESLGYRPNILARSLVKRRSNIIALAIASLQNPFYAQMVTEISERLRSTGRNILLFTAGPDGLADPSLENVLSFSVQAVITAATTVPPKLAKQCQKAGVPIVQINRDSDVPGISTVRGENRTAGEVIADYLISTHHKNFAFIAGTPFSTTSQARLDGFAARLKDKRQIEPRVEYGDYTFEGAARAARSLFDSAPRPDAIFCASDHMALAVLDVAQREYNLRVPEDVSIVGFDNIPEAGHSAFDLTTYSQPAGALAEEAIRIIDDQIAHPRRRARLHEVKGDLIIRGSTRNL